MVQKKGKPAFATNAGGLVSALKSYLSQANQPGLDEVSETLWIGSTDHTEQKFKQIVGANHYTHDGFTVHPVFLPQEAKDKHYHGFSNDLIWPLFHYFPSYANFEEDFFGHYKEVNRHFAWKVVEQYRPGDIIWVHDYHLMLLPEILREMLPDATIGFFLHIPFPSFELFRLLRGNWRREILQGMLGADLVGFHTNDYVQHFLKSVHEILGHENHFRAITSGGRRIVTDVFPISIDFGKFHGAVNDTEVFAERNAIKKRLTGLKIIMSADRLDYTKAIVNRLESFELLLKAYPDYVKQVTYILIVVPSRDIITKYKENKRQVEETVSRINGKYGNLDWTPIVYQYCALDFKRLAGLYLAADAALITPLRDGMNLVAKEFVACRNDKRGVLILSETTGAARELGEALIVNPTDRREIADAINEALQMPVSSQVSRNEIMQKRLSRYDVNKWAHDFLSSLEMSKQEQQNLAIKEITHATRKMIFDAYGDGGKRLIFLDYDGTLAAFAKFPHLASPSQEALDVLARLSADSRNTVVLISGRDRNSLEEWFGHLPLSLVAEHGAFVKRKDALWHPMTSRTGQWKETVCEIMDRYTERCAGALIEEKNHAIAWHYRNAELELGFLRSRELVNALNELSSDLDFQVIEGHMVIEARVRGVDKGTAANGWLANASEKFDFILAIGDDRTDEDIFKVMPEDGYSIRIGLIPTTARFNLKDQTTAIKFLAQLSKAEIVS